MNDIDTNTNPFRITPRLIVGMAILALGILWTLDNMSYIDASHYTRFWPVVLILIGLAKLTDPRASKGGPIVLMLVGAFLLFMKITHMHVDIGDLIPFGLALLGAKLVMDALGRKRPPSSIDDPNAVIHSFAMMAGIHHQSSAQAFRGGDVNAIMGGVELDLRNAQIKDGEEAVIDAFAMWGGIEITVPENWRVAGQVMPLLGGFENKTRATGTGGPLLIIKGTAVMGAVEVKN